MKRDIRVMLVENDPYARDLMGLLLRRDWRTMVVAETGDMTAVPGLLAKMRVDVLLLNTEHPTDPHWAGRIIEAIKEIKKPPLIVVTGTHPNPVTLQSLKAPVYTGYLLKGEIAYSLAWAVTLAAEGNWVVTPTIEALAATTGFAFPRQPVILDGKVDPTVYFSGHDLVLQHFKESLTDIWPEAKGLEAKGRKGHDKDTLAFHLLTIPEIR